MTTQTQRYKLTVTALCNIRVTIPHGLSSVPEDAMLLLLFNFQ